MTPPESGVTRRECTPIRKRLPMKRLLLASLTFVAWSAPNGSLGGDPQASKVVRTFHIGNSLTDTLDGWLGPVSKSAGRGLEFHRFTIPGAPTDWLWDHPGTEGDRDCRAAFAKLAPIDHLFTQPFAGHDRSIANEAEYSGKFFELCRKTSPDVQRWVYAQWPPVQYDDRWSKGEGSSTPLGLKPAGTWQEAAANHLTYTEAVRDRIDANQPGKPVRVVPAGSALARLKSEIDAGRVPGMTDFFAEAFADDIHLTPKGRYLVSLVHDACIFGTPPAGEPDPLTTGLTPEQARRFRTLAWETVVAYRWAKPATR